MNLSECIEIVDCYFSKEGIDIIDREVDSDGACSWRLAVLPGLSFYFSIYIEDEEIYIWLDSAICSSIKDITFYRYVLEIQYYYIYPIRICEKQEVVTAQFRSQIDLMDEASLYFIVSNFLEHSVSIYEFLKENFPVSPYVQKRK
jgi:hypothetical protein